MSQLQDLTRCLLAAGGATHPEGKGTYFLYADRSTLISKHWTGSAFGDGELITDSIRPDSTATYLLSPDVRRIICISSSSTLRALHYDEDDEEWVDDEKFPDLAVHPDGRLAATLDDDGHALVFFQDASGHLIYLNTAGAPIVLPASPIAGSPIAIFPIDDQHLVFYISAQDNRFHYVAQKGGDWADHSLAELEVDTKLRRFMVGQNEAGHFEIFALSEGKKVLQYIANGEGQTRELGKVDDYGNFVPGSSAECCLFVCVWVTVRVSMGINRRRHCCCW